MRRILFLGFFVLAWLIYSYPVGLLIILFGACAHRTLKTSEAIRRDLYSGIEV